MATPTKKQAEGYDVLIWLDGNSDIMTKAYTEKGVKVLKALHPEYSLGDLLVVSVMHPEEFAAAVPEGVKAGFLNPSNNTVYTLPKIKIH